MTQLIITRSISSSIITTIIFLKRKLLNIFSIFKEEITCDLIETINNPFIYIKFNRSKF